MPKYNFTLKNIDPIQICKKYSLEISTNFNETIPIKTTNILELSLERNRNYSYLDETKKEHTCIFTMVDHILNETLSNKTNIKCYWCKHAFKQYTRRLSNSI